MLEVKGMIVSTRIKSYNKKNLTYQIHHDLRVVVPNYVDKSRLDKNRYIPLINANSKQDIENFIWQEWERVKEDFKLHNKRKIKSDAGIIIEGIITFSKEARDFVNDEQNWEELDKLAIEFVKELEKRWNTKGIYVARHSDETTTHYHFAVMNYDYQNHRTIRARLKKKDTSQLQDLVASVFGKLGFKRGKYLAQRLREEGENANVRNWGSVASIHQKMLEEIAQMEEKKKELEEKIEKYTRLTERKEKQIGQLKQLETEMMDKIQKYEKTLETYKKRLDELKYTLEAVLRRKQELDRLKEEINKKMIQRLAEETKLQKLLKTRETIEALKEVKKSKDLLDILRKRGIIDNKQYKDLAKEFGIKDFESIENEIKRRRRGFGPGM